ncbi:hypothetical protein DFH09DRAFT_1092569 [Mycena vulgaris]|nr:hypothetical protein DFH09DRAFT_1092569 [Mycena vulgaris]
MMLAWLFFSGLCDLRVLVVASKKYKYRNCQDRVEHLLGAFYILHNILRRHHSVWDWYMDGLGLRKVEILWSGGMERLRSAPRQQKDNSRTGDNIQNTIKRRDCHMQTYDHPRGATRSRFSAPEGWLWQLGKMGRLSQSEMEEWSNKGDGVQWFREEAEMRQWQEQKEQKLVELLWTIRSYIKMQSVWGQLGDSHANQPGHAAYARQKAWIYERWAEDARNLVRLGGYQALLSLTANVIELSRGNGGRRNNIYLVVYLHSLTHVL